MKKGEVKTSKNPEKETLTGISLDSDLNVPSVKIGYDRITKEPVGVVGGAVFAESGAYKLRNNETFLGNVYRQIYEMKQKGGFNG